MKDKIDTEVGRATAATPQEQAKRRNSNAAKSSRQMNASGGSFKGQQSSKDVRMAAEADLDQLSNVSKGKKKVLPKTLQPLPEGKAAAGMEPSQSTKSLTSSTNAVGQKVYTLAISNVKQNGVGMLANKRR